MALPWLVAIGTEYLVFRWFFAADLAAGAGPRPDPAEPPRAARVRAGHGGVHAGRIRGDLGGRRQPGVGGGGRARWCWRSARWPGAGPPPGRWSAAARRSCAFVLALGMVVRAVVDNGLADALGHLLPGRHRRCPRCSASRRWPPCWPT